MYLCYILIENPIIQRAVSESESSQRQPQGTISLVNHFFSSGHQFHFTSLGNFHSGVSAYVCSHPSLYYSYWILHDHGESLSSKIISFHFQCKTQCHHKKKISTVYVKNKTRQGLVWCGLIGSRVYVTIAVNIEMKTS